MSQVIVARFEGGVFKPDTPLYLPPNTRVRLVIEPLTSATSFADDAWLEIEQLWTDVDVDSGGPPPPRRDELYDRD